MTYRSEHILLVSDSALPEDPLAALFRPALTGRVPLALDATELEVELSPPNARVVVTRRFTNRTDAPVEAVLTLPLPARAERVRAVAVSIDGVASEGRARARTDGPPTATSPPSSHDEHHTIAYETIDDQARIVAVSDIAPGSEVIVRVESVRTLDLLGDHLASLVIPLGSGAGCVTPRGQSDGVPASGTAPHVVTLTVVGDGVSITAQGREHRAASGVAVVIDPAATVSLGIRTTDGRTLGSSGAARRDDSTPLESGRFVFPGYDGATRDDGAALRALARAELPVREIVAPPSTDEGVAPVVPGPSLPEHPDPKRLGARAPTYRWLDASLAAVAALWLLYASRVIHPRLPLLFATTIVILLVDAQRSFPGQGRRVRQRLPVLLVLCAPWIIALVLGPLGVIATNGDPTRVRWMTALQEGALFVSVLLPFALLPFMRHARRFTLDVGALNAIATLVVSSVSLLVISPGS
ncbi:MAG: hypothetical protein ABI601_11595 [bacterium]